MQGPAVVLPCGCGPVARRCTAACVLALESRRSNRTKMMDSAISSDVAAKSMTIRLSILILP